MISTEYELKQLDELHYHYARLYDVLEAALEYANGTHTMMDIWVCIKEGKLQMWYGEESIVLTEILQTPQRSILHFFLIGGKLGELQRMYPGVIEWGKRQGCTRASGTGRAGWERVAFLQEDGWTPTGVVFEKELQDGEGSNTDSDNVHRSPGSSVPTVSL